MLMKKLFFDIANSYVPVSIVFSDWTMPKECEHMRELWEKELDTLLDTEGMLKHREERGTANKSRKRRTLWEGFNTATGIFNSADIAGLSDRINRLASGARKAAGRHVDASYITLAQDQLVVSAFQETGHNFEKLNNWQRNIQSSIIQGEL